MADRSARAPLLVVVHGPPGAGKTTLARALGDDLGLPVLEKDDFKDLLFATLGVGDRDWSMRLGAASWGLIRTCVERLLHSGGSVIVEGNVRPADPLVTELRTLCAERGARCVEVHCTADPEALWERFDGRRAGGGRGPGHVGFEDRTVFLSDLQDRPHGPLGLGDALIELDTTHTWPDPAEVAARVRGVFR